MMWTPEMEYELKALWAKGKRAPDIADLMQMSSSAISSKANKLKLPSRVTRAQNTFICQFECCGAEFFSTNTKSPNHVIKFCSNECRRANEILRWAPQMLRLLEPLDQISAEMGVTRNEAINRAIRFTEYRDSHPNIMLALKDPDHGR